MNYNKNQGFWVLYTHPLMYNTIVLIWTQLHTEEGWLELPGFPNRQNQVTSNKWKGGTNPKSVSPQSLYSTQPSGIWRHPWGDSMKELISFGSSQNIFKISGIKHFQSTRCLFNFWKINFYEAALRSSLCLLMPDYILEKVEAWWQKKKIHFLKVKRKNKILTGLNW